ncbi:MAG: hypothetical protein GF417_11105 [Candidatus Latescibacteria bacterium]|nr:hypothetical protein [Candidatus Latescibacterota bacterium]
MRKFFLLAALLFLTSLSSESYARSEYQTPSLVIDFEGGVLWQTVNDIQIPNSSEGTRFSLVDLAGKSPYPAGRVYITWNINRTHGLKLLLAPFSVTEEVIPEKDLKFEGEEFSGGEVLEATYKFNSWRISYRYRFRDGEKASWYIGFTAKVRDARIELVQNGNGSDKPDLGFVPLLHLGVDWRISRNWSLISDLDALAGGPGRAIDFSAKFYYRINSDWSIGAGYRTLEGGADVEEVYNFAWLHYGIACIRYRY